MSKHRIKAVALETEYDDYDEEDIDDGGEDTLTADDKEQLRLGTIQVRSLLSPGFPATDQEIQDALWHYYYDVGKSVSYLKNQKRPPPILSAKKTAASSTHKSSDAASVQTFARTLSAKEFFMDCPWFNIPQHRKAPILIEPLYPRGGLLGGSAAGPGDGKMSKLAALAAKRRQKENDRLTSSASLSPGRRDDKAKGLSSLRSSANEQKPAAVSANSKDIPSQRIPSQPLKYADEEDRGNAPARTESYLTPDTPSQDPVPKPPLLEQNIRASPSSFAMTIIGDSSSSVPPDSVISSTTISVDALAGALAKSFDFTGPSPDDVVTKAQNSKESKASKPSAKQMASSKAKADLMNGVRALNIEEPVKIKSRNLDVIAEYKKVERKNAANFVVIGHVDAGKSTLMGRLLFDLKAVDQRTMDRYRKEAERIGKGSFAFAWVLDQGTEERARGVTIDIATNKFETDKTNFTILDAPGHRDFVPNMIAGASQADFAVLVIDASTGNFESGLKGQTKEHALLVRSMGVQKVIVAVNKMDAVDWSRDRFQEIEQQMSAFLTTAGFQPKNLSFIPCSGLQGDNILRPSREGKLSWYRGHTLVEELDTSEPTIRALDKPLRMTIGDVFRGGITNPLSVSGRLESGTLQTGEQILVQPSGEKATIKNIEVDDEPHDWAVAGQNVSLHLNDIDPVHLKTGDVICSPTVSPIQNTTNFTAKVLAFDHLTPMHVDVHRGRLHVPGRIGKLVATLDKVSGAVLKRRPKIVQPGAVARVVVEMDQAVPLDAGRIVLRANGETVAAGLIE